MKDFEYKFIASNGVKTKVKISIVLHDSIFYVLFSDQDFGVSVTNCTEHLAEAAVHNIGVTKDRCRFFENYPQYNKYEVDEIWYDWLPYESPKNPRWQRVNDQELLNIVFGNELMSKKISIL